VFNAGILSSREEMISSVCCYDTFAMERRRRGALYLVFCVDRVVITIGLPFNCTPLVRTGPALHAKGGLGSLSISHFFSTARFDRTRDGHLHRKEPNRGCGKIGIDVEE